jgi:hypothetical protein
MVNRREVPACAFACPTGALSYGPRTGILALAERKLAAYRRGAFPAARIYGKDEFDGMRMIVILKDNPEKYGIPINPPRLEVAKAEHAKDIYALLSVFTFGLKPLKRSAYRLSRSLAGLSGTQKIS